MAKKKQIVHDTDKNAKCDRSEPVVSVIVAIAAAAGTLVTSAGRQQND
jgi:hypothetical protein